VKEHFYFPPKLPTKYLSPSSKPIQRPKDRHEVENSGFLLHQPKSIFLFRGIPGQPYLLKYRAEACFHPCPISHLGQDVPHLALSLLGILVALPSRIRGPTIEAELVASRQPYSLFPVEKETDVCVGAVNRQVICLDTPSRPMEGTVLFNSHKRNSQCVRFGS